MQTERFERTPHTLRHKKRKSNFNRADSGGLRSTGICIFTGESKREDAGFRCSSIRENANPVRPQSDGICAIKDNNSSAYGAAHAEPF